MSQFASAMWVISPEEKSKTEVIFNSLKPNNGKLSGDQAKKYLMLSNLPTPTLGQIWQLSDMDNDGKMTLQEFTIAVHLIQAKCRGVEVPKVLPYSLKSSSTQSHSVFGGSGSTPVLNPMNNGTVGAPSMGLQRGGMLTPMPLVSGSSISGMSSSFSSSGQFSTSYSSGNQLGFSNVQSAFTAPSNPPGFHTGMSGSSTFPRNFHPAQAGTPYAQGMSSLDSLGLMTAPSWNQTSQDKSFHQNVNRAPSLGSAHISSSSSGQFSSSSSSSSLGGIQFGSGAQSVSSVDSSSFGSKATTGQIPPANRLKYTQMFKAADNEKNGCIKGEQARQLLIQSGIPPEKLAKIWDLSDLNKDGNLDLDEFVIAMHLIDLAKSGQSIPVTLPPELIPVSKKFSTESDPPLQDVTSDGRRGRSESVSSVGKPEPVTFEDKRKLNYEKGRQELERRRKEIQDRLQREKEERERKEREEEERKRKIREEAERRKQEQIENERRQREEMEREQEAQRKKLIEQRHAAQLEAERQRQREWEQRRKEELLNQKGLEEDIVKGLKSRLEKLKGELTETTTQRDHLAESLENRKRIFNELMTSISDMSKSRTFGQSQITQYLNGIQKMKSLVAELKEERERLNVEINKRDSTTTSEALGGVRASIQQTKANIPRLKGHLVALEAKTDDLLKENDFNARQLPTIKAALQIKIDENNRLKHSLEQKKKEYLTAKQRVEEEARRADAVNRRKREDEDRKKREVEARKQREEMLKKQKEDERRKQKEKEQQAMKIEQQRQEESMRRIHSAQAAEKQSKMEKAKQLTAEAIQKQQNMKVQQNVEVASHSAAIQDLFTASSVKGTAMQGSVQPIPPPKKVTKPAAPPRPKARPVASRENVKDPVSKPEQNLFGNWDAIADLDFSRQKPETDLMEQLQEATGKKSLPAGNKEKKENELLEKFEENRKLREEEKRRKDEERRREEETKRQKEEEEERKIEAARRQLEEEKRKREEAMQKRKEEERRKGEAERRRWELELKRRQEEEQEEEAMMKLKEATRLARENEKLEMEKQRAEEERKQKEREEVQRKVEEMQKMKRMKKQQQEGQQEAVATVKEQVDSRLTKGSTDTTVAKSKAKYKVLFPFEARHPDELSILDGDIVFVDESDTTPPPGWFRGTCEGATGLFPANYAEKMPKDTFSDYVDLDKNARVPFATEGRPVMQKTPSDDGNNTSSVVQQQQQNLQQQIQQQLQQQQQKKHTQQQQQDFKTPQVAPKKAALIPKANVLPKSTDSSPPSLKPSAIKARAGSLPESIHDRTSSFGSSEGTDGSYQDSVSQGSVKSVASSLGKKECYENVLPPVSLEGPSPTQESLKVVDDLQAVALYPYRGKKDDHLTFSKNDQIIVKEQQEMWWYGESNNKSGWFPKSYVKIIGTIKSPSLILQDDTCDASSIASSTSSVATEHSGGEQNYVGECVALFDYVGVEGDLTFNEGDVIKITKKETDWWEGVLRGECGFFPANYVKVKEQTEAPKKPEVATVISPFPASDAREISLSPGQLIHILKKDQGGWWQGELQARGKKRQVGWFPASHVKLLAKSSDSSNTSEQFSHEDIEDDIYAVPQKRENPAEQVLALFSYTAQNEDELTFYKGSVINVISREGDWWRGELNGQVGMFPYNYVQLLSDLPDNSNQWEGSFDSAVLKSMTKSERQRQNYIHELINTEQIFMDDLSLTLECFYNPMAEAGVLTEQELNTVFVNWREIIMCNTKLLKALLVRKTMSVNNKVEAVGDILVEQIPRLTPYIRFCSCQIKACKLLQRKVENDADFKQFEKKCAGNRSLRQNLPLSSYLLKPLQRITKYPLIIKQIIKYTPEEHHDRQNLEQALEQIEELCSEINENIRMVESSSRLEWLQSHVNLEGLGEKLVFNSQTNCLGQRKYIHHSTLYKHKSNKELRAFLFNDFLLFTRQHGTSQSTRSFSTIFKDDVDGEITLSIYKKPIFLNEIVVKLPIDADVNDTLFCLSHIDRIYTLRAETKNERNAWLNKLQKASESFIETERRQRKRAHRARSVLGQGLGRLTVVVIEGCDLQASDPTGTSDPYCEVSIGSQEHKTKVVPKTLNPKWNSQMLFTVKDIEQDVLCISVFDRDFFSPNDFLGRTELSISSLLKEGPGPWMKRLLLHEVPTGEIVLRASFQKFEYRK